MLSLFPPLGPSLPPFSTLLVKGAFHQSAPIHLAIGHVNESSENEVLILSPSRQRLEQKLASGLDEWLFSSGTSNEARTALSRITILLEFFIPLYDLLKELRAASSYPPSPVHFSLLMATLDGIQSFPELLDLWAELPVIPTENLSMIILDDISSYFAAADQAEHSMISLINRVMQAISRTSKRYDRTTSISLACFESTFLGPKLTKEPVQQRSMHMESAILSLFQWVCHVEGADVLSIAQPIIPSSQGEENVESMSGKVRLQKTLRITSTLGETEGQTVIDYIEALDYRPDCCPVIRFLWQ